MVFIFAVPLLVVPLNWIPQVHGTSIQGTSIYGTSGSLYIYVWCVMSTVYTGP